MEKYNISRFEQQGESLFICLNSSVKPVYLEHFFTPDEQLDIAGTIEGLVAELELLGEAYVAPLPRIDRLAEAKTLEIKSENIAVKKTAIIAEKVRVEAKRLEDVKPVEVLEKITP